MGLEVCRVNYGGVSAHLSGGWVVRIAGGEPASRLMGLRIAGGERQGSQGDSIGESKKL